MNDELLKKYKMAKKICLHRNKVLSPNRDDAKAALKNVLSKAADGEIMINRYKDGNVIKVLIGIHTDSTEAGITKDFILDSDAMPKDADELTGLIDEEMLRAIDTEDTIKVAVGLDENGSHKTTTGHYTNKATTVVGEIAALDTQVYTNTGNIATVKGIADKNTQDIATINGKLAVASNVTVEGSTNITVTPSTEGADNHKVFTVEAKNLVTTTDHNNLAGRVTNTENSITTLNGAANVTGSVDNKIAAALSWIEGGTY